MSAASGLNGEETRRYARHIVLKGMGGAGQLKLKAARIAVVGAGALGSPAIAYLAAAGTGKLTVIDADQVSLSNLQRQILHRTEDIGAAKGTSAARFAAALNPHVAVTAREEKLTADNAAQLLAGHDVVLDGSDNLATRIAVARAAETLRLPLVSGAVSMFDGQVTVFAPHLERQEGGSYPGFRALYPEGADDADLPGCEATGVLGPLTGVIGALMAMEAVKLITGIGTPLLGRLLLYDGKAGRMTEVGY
jgi:molybdopterin/thiamine biosynthesis adenylyltransferase